MKHFEELWDEAEKATKSAHSDLSRNDILQRARDLLTIYAGLDDSSKDPKITKEFIEFARNKAIGDLLFVVANLSATDNIDVYRALSDAVQRSRR